MTYLVIVGVLFEGNFAKTKCYKKLQLNSLTRLWNKKYPNFSKSCKKSSHTSFYLKSENFPSAQKLAK